MPKQLKFQLSDDELALVEEAMHHDARAPVRLRATALRMLHRGYRVAEIASVLDVTEASVYGWVRRWQEGGLPGLANRARLVERRKVTESYRQALSEALEQAPSVYGYSFANWTLERLRDHLATRTGVHITESWLGTLVREAGYVYRRPKHDLSHLQDPEAKQRAADWLDDLKRGPRRGLSNSSLWTKRP